MAELSQELIEVGYYLSKCGISNPPSRFCDAKRNEIYRMVHRKKEITLTIEELKLKINKA